MVMMGGFPIDRISIYMWIKDMVGGVFCFRKGFYFRSVSCRGSMCVLMNQIRSRINPNFFG